MFLLSVRAAAAGLTLTSASYVFIVEPGFNPAITLQAINRVWRVRRNTTHSQPPRRSESASCPFSPCLILFLLVRPRVLCVVGFCQMGQQKQVEVRYLVCEDSVEESVLTIAREKMSKRKAGAADDAELDGILALLPEIEGCAAARSGKKAADAAAADSCAATKSAAAAAAAGIASVSPSSDDDSPSAAAAADRGRRVVPAGRGVVMGHATVDAMPDMRINELERLFEV